MGSRRKEYVSWPERWEIFLSVFLFLSGCAITWVNWFVIGSDIWGHLLIQIATIVFLGFLIMFSMIDWLEETL